MPTSSIDTAVGELDPADRALLELSLRQRVPDGEIAELLGTARADVATRRAGAVEQVAERLGAARPEDQRRVESALRRHFGGDGAVPPRRGHGLRGALIATLLLAAVTVVAVVVIGGAEPVPVTGGVEAPAGPDGLQGGVEAAPAESSAVPLEPLPGTAPAGEVTASVEGSGGDAVLELRVSELADPEDHEVWLFNSLIDSVSLGRLRPGDGTFSVDLPRDAFDYDVLDVSIEPRDGDPGHSGRSVLRVPLDELRG